MEDTYENTANPLATFLHELALAAKRKEEADKTDELREQKED